MITIEQLKHYKQVDKSITYNIHGLNESDVESVYLQLCDKYNKVVSHVGRFIGTAEFYGYFQVYE